jgi:hypothetical protein
MTTQTTSTKQGQCHQCHVPLTRNGQPVPPRTWHGNPLYCVGCSAKLKASVAESRRSGRRKPGAVAKTLGSIGLMVMVLGIALAVGNIVAFGIAFVVECILLGRLVKAWERT